MGIMSSGSRASQPWLQSRYAPKMVKGDLSLLQKKTQQGLPPAWPECGTGKRVEMQLDGRYLVGAGSTWEGATRQRRKGTQPAPWFLPTINPPRPQTSACESRRAGHGSFAPLGFSPVRLSLPH